MKMPVIFPELWSNSMADDPRLVWAWAHSLFEKKIEDKLADDEGILDVKVYSGRYDDMMLIDFGKDVRRIEITRKDAQDLALMILRCAADAHDKYIAMKFSDPSDAGKNN
jgi:hypothetical protein